MSLKGALVVIGCLVAIVLLFAFYIFPNFMCGTNQVPGNRENQNFKDPIVEFCRVAK